LLRWIKNQNERKKEMSRIGKKAIDIPKEVSIKVENEKIIVKGKNGSLEREVLNKLNLEILNEQLVITRKDDTKASRSYHGLIRALIQNMVTGVNENFSKTLVAEGVGYKFQVEKTKLILSVGFSHPVEFEIPSDITLKAESPTRLVISGIDKEKVGFFAAKVRDMRPPEPYKGKGLLYQGEKILRKAGKTGK
jgi:large subunit ribosomal protein L6